MTRPLDFKFDPIAYVRTHSRYRYEEARQPVFSRTPAVVEFLPGKNFEVALADLKGFERVWLIFVFHLNETWNPLVRPPLTPEDRKYGVFATRSPHRPNPIGLSCVEVESLEGLTMHLKTCDLLDATPILDVKPYIPEVDAFPESAAGWRDQLKTLTWDLEFDPVFCEESEFLASLGAPDIKAFCKIQLGTNPLDFSRKRLVQLDKNRYAIGCRTWKAIFEANERNHHIRIREIISNYRQEELEPGTADHYGDKDWHRSFLQKYPCAGRKDQ